MLQGHLPVVHRAVRGMRRAARVVIGLAVAASISAWTAASVDAASPKVVIVVGPSAGPTDTYISRARGYASLARSLGASVVELYTPHATWSRVSSAAQGARVLIYLGHGNGYPSPYTSSLNAATQDGFGLNPYDGSGYTSPVKYYGESSIASTIRLAPTATVLLNHLCYASGSSEPGKPAPSWDIARQRVDNFAAGFIRAGARAVIADAHHPLDYELRLALSSGRNFLASWRKSPLAQGHERSFASKRSPGYTNYLDPDGTGTGFYRALTTTPGFTTGGVPATAAPVTSLTGTATTAVLVRSAPSTDATAVTTVSAATTVVVTAGFTSDASGRTWAPVRTSAGGSGYIAAWLLRFSGSAVPTTSAILRSAPTVSSTALATVPPGSRVTVTGSAVDGSYRAWLAVRAPAGQAGYVAAWLMKP